MKNLFNRKSKSDMTSDSEFSSESELDEDIDENGLAEKRAEFFIYSIVEYFEQKFKEYGNIADVDGAAKQIKIMGQNLPKASKTSSMPSSTFAFIPLILKYVYILFAYITQFILGKKHRNRAKKLVNIFQNIPDQERRAVFAETGADIYYSFQYQLNQIADVNGYWKRGLRKVAKDARDRAMRYLAKQDFNSIGAITPEILTRAVLLGTPKSMYGHTIKLARSEEELKTSDLFGVLGLKVKYGDVGTIYYYKVTLAGHVGSSACEYRFALDWEKKGRWEQYYKKVETAVRSLDASEICEPSTLAAIVQKVLQKFKDSASQREEITAGVERIEGSLNKIDTGVDHIQRDLNQIGTGVDRIQLGFNQTVCEVSRIGEGVHQIESKANCIQEGVNQLLDQRHNTNRGHQNETPLRKFRFNFRKPVTNFSGREKELKTLHDLLGESAQNVVITQCATIRGLGGIGKTELARMYACRYATESYDENIIWIDAETVNSRTESFEKLAKKLGVPIQKQNENQEEPIGNELLEEVYERLSLSKCLIIYDNAEIYEDIKQYLLQSSVVQENRPAILITSRSDNWEVGEEGFIKSLPLDVFKKDEALSFVKDKLEIPQTETSLNEKIDELTKLLSWFPLALRTAVGFLKSSRIKVTKENLSERIDKYIELYEKNAEQCLNYSSSLDRYKKTVYNTWRTTFDRIKMDEEFGEMAIDLMEKIAYCRPDYISFKIGMNLEQRGDKGEIRRRKEIWLLLSEYSLISTDEDNIEKGVRVHRLVQEVVRLWIREGEREETVLRNFLSVIDEEEKMFQTDIWNYASKYLSLIDDFALNNEFPETIEHLLSLRNFEGVDNIISRLEKLENTSSNVDWRMVLRKRRILDNMNDNIAKYVCLFWAHFQRNLKSSDTDSLIRFDKFLEKFAKQYDKRILLDIWYDLGITPLHMASHQNNLRLVEWLMDKGANPTALDIVGLTAIHHAVAFNKLEILILLMTGTEECNYIDQAGRTPLHCAVCRGNYDAVKFLLENDADPTIPNIDGDNAIHMAVNLKLLDILQLFVNKRESLISQSNKGETALRLAVDKRWYEGVQFLAANGVDPTILGDEGLSAIHLAAKCRNVELLQMFSLNGVKCNVKTKYGETPLHIALAANGEYWQWNPLEDAKPVVEFLLEKGADPLICDNEGRNAIWYALKYGHTEAVRLFIERGILTSSTRFKNEQSPLHVAVASGAIEIVRIVLEAGAEVDSKDDGGARPLHLVFESHRRWCKDELSECENVLIIRLLIDGGAEKNCADNDGVKLIHLASKHGHLSIMKLCAESGCDYESITKNGRTPLHYAADGGKLDVVKFLLDEREVSPNTMDNENMTPVATALLKGHQELVELFLERELFEVNVELPNGRYPLQLALDSGDFYLVRFLIDQGADSRLAGNDGVKAVHLAAKAGDVDFLQRFADDKNELESRTANGWTPLHLAACSHNKSTVKYLLENTVDPYVPNNNGLSAFAIAIEFSDLSDVQPFLDSHIEFNAHFNAIGITPLIHALLCFRQGNDLLHFLRYQNTPSIDADGYKDTLLGKLQISALHVAAFVHNYEAVKILTDDYKMDVNSGLNVSWTPLQAAPPHSSVASFLTSRGAKVAEDNSSVYRDILQDFLKDPENRKLVDFYTRNLKYFRRFDVDRILNFTANFV